MPAAHDSPSPSDTSDELPAIDVAPEKLAAARKQARLPKLSLTATCPAGRLIGVLEPDGAMLACDYASPAVEGQTEGKTEGNRLDTAQLRDALANHQLPSNHCYWCARWSSHGILSLAPPVRDYGCIAGETETQVPGNVTVRVDEHGLSPQQAAWLRSAAKDLRLLTVEIRDIASDAGKSTLASISQLAQVPTVALRLEQLPNRKWSGQALQSLRIATMELTAVEPDVDWMSLRRIAEACGATPLARFVITPARWFEIEHVVQACTEAGIALDLRVLDRKGNVPMAQVGIANLHFVNEVVEQATAQLRAAEGPSAVAPDAIPALTNELHSVLHTLAEQAMAGQALASRPIDIEDAEAILMLPPATHSWNKEQDATWWWASLLGHTHLECVQDWAVNTVAQIAENSSEEPAWLRQLCHRIALEQHSDALLQRLRFLYGPLEARKRLAAEDAAFLATFAVDKFGGPWANALGLHAERRTQLLEVGTPSAPPSKGKPDITVLIPSYRHEEYIVETLRSVLAQKYANFRVLVVDDRSPDATVAKANEVDDPRIEVRVNPENLGLGNSVLAALESIDTPYVALLNSDDLIHPERLGACRDVLNTKPDVQLVTTGIALIDHDGGELTPDNASLILDGRKVYDWVHWFERNTPEDELPASRLFPELLERNFLVTSSNLVARTDWLRKQADSLRSLKYCLDWQLFLEAALEGALHHIHEPLVAYRLHASNTVWFREGRRWAYYLEVNRVAADALKRFSAQSRLTDLERLPLTLDAIANHLAANSEVDGLALYLHALVDALQLDDAAASSEQVQGLIEVLNERSEKVKRAADIALVAPAATATTTHHPATPSALAGLRKQITDRDIRLMFSEEHQAELSKKLEELYADQRERIAFAEQLQEQLRELYEDQAARINHANNLEADKSALLADQQVRIQQAAKLEGEKKALYEDQRLRIEQAQKLESEKQALYIDQKIRIEQLEKQLRELYADQARRIEQAKQLEADKHKLRRAEEHQSELSRQANERAEALEASRQVLKRDMAELQADLELRQHNLLVASSTIAEQSAKVESLTDSKNKLEHKRNDLLHQVAKLKQEMERLMKTREYRTGNLIWNKMPLGYMSRRGKKWYRRLVNAKDRAKMMFKGSSKKAHGTAIVAACWQWPIYSHTFVYQEMISLSHMGLDVQLFHWDLGSTDQLHAAFQYLFDNRTQLQPVWESHKKDKEHFDKTKPGKLRSFLERIAPLCGKSVEDLEKEPIVLQGCTFARMAELAQARYIHSYFFYDQSFMAMQAAWLLDLPRGVSCYADHMMNDYPWKFVPLHVELCDVIVATSARIKSELSNMTGGKFDDKIVVKPNGVDGDRFPARQRPPRDVGDAFEVLSVSRIEPKKGLTHLVEAIAELKKRGHHVIAHIIGSKDEHSKGSLEYAAEFEACIAEHGLQDQVILHGMMKQEQMPPIIERCRAFVAPYVETESGDKDGIPTAMLEALASSLPVITTNSGSIVEVIDSEVEGLVVGQRDSMAFAEALQKIIVDPALEKRMAIAARARFDKDFDIRVTEKRLHERVAGFLARKT